MNDQSFEDAVNRIAQKHPDIDSEAYYFLREGLDFAVHSLGRDEAKDHHVTGREFCEGLRDYALQQFGPLALLTLTQWGLYETADFGTMVYRLIEEGVFGKKPSDKKDDFADIYDFEEAFDAPYLPKED